ncbi:type IV secretion system protein VirB5 [Bartonella sp. Raccoon60]|uniref:type IV secretion system protein VirB5 n=1 Tax=Bartonella sp. Raccoon60 TaxID=1933912 RepID=UPI0009C31242|nr:type IV secretion system protein VirB5 [Bartonella sp. Raccoon60]AQX26740.1 hypothetical protein Bra60_007380 [Bartonella sp. Raccoon60]AQX27378.1 hypothetical protein Bra60_014110 [Bartonella sp. Raccoon60]
MKKYLIMFLSLCFISHAISQSGSTEVDSYYQNVTQQGTPLSEDSRPTSEIAESIYTSAVENQKKIQEINNKFSSQTLKPEEKEALQRELAILQANLQVDTLKLQASSIMKSENAQSKEQEREKEEQKNQEALQQTLQDKLDQAKAKVKY